MNNMNKKYLISVLLLIFIIPTVGFLTEHFLQNTLLTFDLFAKWFIFSAVGLRLLIAGIRQAINPGFTAKEIFHIEKADSCFPIVRELGFANICFGLVGIISLFKPEWRVVCAFASGLYFALAALLHIIRKQVGINKSFALWTNLIIFGVLLTYFITII